MEPCRIMDQCYRKNQLDFRVYATLKVVEWQPFLIYITVCFLIYFLVYFFLSSILPNDTCI